MDLISVKEAAEKWGVTVRRVQGLCSEGKIKGAVRFGGIWMIPAHAVLPSTARHKQASHPMPRKSPFLDMTNLYNRAGSADECAALLVNNREAHSLFEACIAYHRGDIDFVYRQARFFLASHSGFYAFSLSGSSGSPNFVMTYVMIAVLQRSSSSVGSVTPAIFRSNFAALISCDS